MSTKRKSKYVTVYDKQNYQNDEESFSNSTKENKSVDLRIFLPF